MRTTIPNKRTVRINQAGKLTLIQLGNVILSALLSGGFCVLLGVLGNLVAINRFAGQPAADITVAALAGFVILAVFALGLVLYGLQHMGIDLPPIIVPESKIDAGYSSGRGSPRAGRSFCSYYLFDIETQAGL